MAEVEFKWWCTNILKGSIDNVWNVYKTYVMYSKNNQNWKNSSKKKTKTNDVLQNTSETLLQKSFKKTKMFLDLKFY